MSSILQLSEASLLALHSMALIAKSKNLVSTKEIAATLDASENHLAKVLQRLVKNNFVTSIRGPKGGFKLQKDPAEITLLDVYEAIEGKAELKQCHLNNEKCPFGGCILGNLNAKFHSDFMNYFKNKTLKDFL